MLGVVKSKEGCSQLIVTPFFWHSNDRLRNYSG
ncbi:MAG: hypothetical protein ACI93L_001583, partial [Cyclobacteriaceae bacterium]